MLLNLNNSGLVAELSDPDTQWQKDAENDNDTAMIDALESLIVEAEQRRQASAVFDSNSNLSMPAPRKWR